MTGDQSRFYVELAEAIAGEGPDPVPPDQAIRVMAVMEAAMRSASQGRAVSPELPRQVAGEGLLSSKQTF
ncbi:putative oxidoreductase [compost metagenome]